MTAVHCVVVGGPQAGEAVTVDSSQARWGVTLLEAPRPSMWEGDASREVPTATYRLVAYAPVVGLTMNLLVRSSIAERDLHDHLGVLFTPAAQAAFRTG